MDYKDVKFKSGLEIHQQLDTNKLFCNCPSILRSDEPDYQVERRLHAVTGESGEIDVAALYQSSLNKKFVYQGYDTTCLVELDEEPPHKINEEALKIATDISLLLNCKMVPITQVMRKTVIDGSNTSGFQRTVLVARDGKLETSQGDVTISYVYLEEDACRVVERREDQEIYKLDRLGIPLVEVVTGPDVKNPEHAKEVALKIGDILRSCKVKRGIGTIRQDVNISVGGGERVEIKGMQDMNVFISAIENEVSRQINLNNLKSKVPSFKKIEVKELVGFISPSKDWMKKVLEKGTILGFKLKGFKGLLGKELFPGYRVGTELARYAKTRGFNGVIHGDENLEDKYGFSKKEIADLKKALEVSEKDSFILVFGEEEKAQKMIEEVLFERIANLKKGVLNEVRNVLKDSTTEFLRPMPGSSRMYPETDLPLLRISKQFIDKTKKTLPKLRSEEEKDLKKKGLSQEMIKLLFKQNKLIEFKDLLLTVDSPQLVAKVLLMYPKEISKHLNVEIKKVQTLFDENLVFVLQEHKNGKISEGEIKSAMERIVSGKTLKEAVSFEKADLGEVEEKIMKLIKSKPGLRENAYMGLVMKEFKGQVDGKQAMQIIKKYAN